MHFEDASLQQLAGWCWLLSGASFPLHTGFSVGLLECLHNMNSDFPQREMDARWIESQAGAVSFWWLASHTVSHFCYILWLDRNHKVQSTFLRREINHGLGKGELSKNLQIYFKTTITLIAFSRNMLNATFFSLQHFFR